MSSSITTVVPSGAISNWCLAPVFGFNLSQSIPKCVNATSEYQSICCNGNIVDKASDPFVRGPLPPIDLNDLVCCAISGTQDFRRSSDLPGASATTCVSGDPTPLASLAATNAENADVYILTYTNLPTGFSFDGGGVATGTPYCIWLNTASGVAMSTVTVQPAPQATSTPNTGSPETSANAAPSKSGAPTNPTLAQSSGTPSVTYESPLVVA
ncbi:hypothetical protein GQ53DRAFT_772981 [Thozetella sp. PMI_491]|nr:hypothetical protein GQ53DRAFT_772981 [Thozetella sp. PMI_491]